MANKIYGEDCSLQKNYAEYIAVIEELPEKMAYRGVFSVFVYQGTVLNIEEDIGLKDSGLILEFRSDGMIRAFNMENGGVVPRINSLSMKSVADLVKLYEPFKIIDSVPSAKVLNDINPTYVAKLNVSAQAALNYVNKLDDIVSAWK